MRFIRKGGHIIPIRESGEKSPSPASNGVPGRGLAYGGLGVAIIASHVSRAARAFQVRNLNSAVNYAKISRAFTSEGHKLEAAKYKFVARGHMQQALTAGAKWNKFNKIGIAASVVGLVGAGRMLHNAFKKPEKK